MPKIYIQGPDEDDSEENNNVCFKYCENFLKNHEEIYKNLLEELDIDTEDMSKHEGTNRLSEIRLLDTNYSLDYYGYISSPKGFTKTLLYLNEILYKELNVKFNAVLINYYRGGFDYLGYHSDKEVDPEIPDIASLTFGETRLFRLRKKGQTKGYAYEFALKGGSLFHMFGDMQTRFLHSVIKTAKPVKPRLNLTFRYFRVES